MPISEFLTSTFGIFLSATFVLGLPFILLKQRFSDTPAVVLVLATLGLYATLSYLLGPGPVKGTLVPIVCLLAWWFSRGPQRKASAVRFEIWGAVALLICCLTFFFRWEPSGTDPVKWGSYAKLIEVYRQLPGDTRPLAPVENIGGINLGLPILIELLHWSDRAMPWERVIHFTESLSLFLFIASLALAFKNWVSSSAAWGGAILALLLFTNPQQYLVWGGTPSLVGLSAGLLLLAWTSGHYPKCGRETLLWALALVFAAHAHPIGVYLSFLILGPVILFRVKSSWKALATLGAVSAFLFLAFFRHWGFQASPEEIRGVWDWQKSMAPYLFQPGNPLYQLYIQVATYAWSTAFWIGIVAFLASLKERKDLDWKIAFGLPLGIIFLLVANTWSWTLPLSFLVYPERAATLLVFPLGLGLAWACEFSGSLRHRIFLLVVLVLGLQQFTQRTASLWGNGVFTPSGRSAAANVSAQVPFGECIKVTSHTLGVWIPVLGFRCTVPYHVLSESIQEESKAMLLAPLHWEFQDSRLKPLSNSFSHD